MFVCKRIYKYLRIAIWRMNHSTVFGKAFDEWCPVRKCRRCSLLLISLIVCCIPCQQKITVHTHNTRLLQLAYNKKYNREIIHFASGFAPVNLVSPDALCSWTHTHNKRKINVFWFFYKRPLELFPGGKWARERLCPYGVPCNTGIATNNNEQKAGRDSTTSTPHLL